jgi:rod shape-determining protein MreB
MIYTDIGIDLGTSNIVIWYKGRGVIIHEPTLAAYDKEHDRLVAFGEEARQLILRNTSGIVAIKPFKAGTISDYSVTERLMRHYIQVAMGRHMFRKPYISLCVPSGITEVERRAVVEAAYQAGARDVVIVEEVVAAAIGAGIDVTKPVGNLVVDIGGGTTDIAVISLGAPVIKDSIRVAGSDFNEAITRAIRRDHSLFIDLEQVEQVKIKIGTAVKLPKNDTFQITGRNVMTGLPKTVTITSEEMCEALHDSVTKIADAVHGVLERITPELAADITQRGIVITGGGALLTGMTTLLEEKTGINTMVAENTSDAVALGTGYYTELMDRLGRIDY